MKRIISLIAILCMMFSLTVCAVNKDGTIQYYTKNSSVAPGEEFSVLINVVGDTDTTVGLKAGSLTLTYPSDLVTVTNYVVGDTGLTSNLVNTTAGKVLITCRPGEGDTYKTGNFTLVTITFKVKETATGTISIQTTTNASQFAVGNTSYKINTVKPSLNLTINAGSTDVVIKDETFETEGFTSSDVTSGNVVVDDKNIEMGTNGKVYTYFKKTTKALTGGEYGITATINGKTYKFPGKANVGENGKWAIKLVVPNGTFSDGTTSVGTITNATPYGID